MALLTVICHFYDEEFLLPHWLTHHARLFDHGVLIDYASRDGSVEVCRALVPDWEVRPSRNAWFDAHEVDREVMDIEREFEGWKMALNTTEFVFHPDLRGYLSRLESEEGEVGCVAMRCAVLCDGAQPSAILADEPLVLQRHHGYVDTEQRTRRLRYLHRHPDGGYHVGRHGTRHAAQLREDILLLWFGWSPWVARFKARKLQIQSRIPDHDRRAGLGKEHILTSEQLEEVFGAHRAISYDLLEDPVYRDLHARVRDALRAQPYSPTMSSVGEP